MDEQHDRQGMVRGMRRCWREDGEQEFVRSAWA